MNRSEVTELHNIQAILNLPSILTHGLLSHRRASRILHSSIAMSKVQQRRAQINVPGGRKLHEYANLYFDARNPMMFVRKQLHGSLCVLRISPDVLDLPDVVVTDRNASSGYCRFAAAPNGLNIVRQDLVYAEDWTHSDQIEYRQRKSIRCAEVLIPDRVDITFVTGIYVSSTGSVQAVQAAAPSIPVTVNPYLFFQKG